MPFKDIKQTLGVVDIRILTSPLLPIRDSLSARYKQITDPLDLTL